MVRLDAAEPPAMLARDEDGEDAPQAYVVHETERRQHEFGDQIDRRQRADDSCDVGDPSCGRDAVRSAQVRRRARKRATRDNRRYENRAPRCGRYFASNRSHDSIRKCVLVHKNPKLRSQSVSMSASSSVLESSSPDVRRTPPSGMPLNRASNAAGARTDCEDE